MTRDDRKLDRRDFIGTLGAAAALGMTLAACKSESEPAAAAEPTFLDQAPEGDVLKAGLVGCGGRGSGAALGDVFQDRLDDCRNKLRDNKGVEVPDSSCFLGFDAFRRVIDSGVDIVLLATPPHFRPEHFAACVEARKHVFMEKPVAVDPVGARSVIVSSKKVEASGLCVATGTQRRHQRDYVATYHQIRSGAIGEIVSANCYWNQAQLWYRDRDESWSDMEYMIRDWVNWCWLSGDHIVEQHVHNLDVVHWFTGKHPVRAVGFGARQRRKTGDQYDFFSVDYVYDNRMHVHSMCRQIDGCATNVSEFVMGTEGYSNCRNKIHRLDGSVVWEYDYGVDDEGNPRKGVKVSPYVQEHIDLVTAIRTGEQIVEAENTAISTLVAIMGRISAYTGQAVTYEEMMGSGLRLGPTTYEMGPVAIEAVAPVPGVEAVSEEKAE